MTINLVGSEPCDLFGPATAYGAGSNPYSVAIGDFNADTKPDMAVADSGSNDVSVLLGNGDGSFQSAVNYASGGNSPWSVVVSDFNSDGNPDMAVANVDSENVSVLVGNGAGPADVPSIAESDSAGAL